MADANRTVRGRPSADRGLGFFERYLTVWVVLCILAGIVLGRLAPGVAAYLDGVAIGVGGAPIVSISSGCRSGSTSR